MNLLENLVDVDSKGVAVALAAASLLTLLLGGLGRLYKKEFWGKIRVEVKMRVLSSFFLYIAREIRVTSKQEREILGLLTL